MWQAPMIRLGNSARFTPRDVDELRQIGLDMADVKAGTISSTN
jgi:hypothetical protein